MKKTILMLLALIFVVGCSNVQEDTGNNKKEIDESQIVNEVVEEVTEPESGDVVIPDSSTYQKGEMSVTVPDSWKDKYIVIENENGFAFYQKASYEKTEGLGYLYGFYRADNMVAQYAGETQIAYTDEFMYYMQEPTDVNCYYEDQTIVSEYTMMMEEREKIKSSLVVSGENVSYDAHEYVLPMSHVKNVEEHILVNLSSDELWIARNEIYARHGRVFTNEYLSAYFASCSWYEPTVAAEQFDESVLSQMELDNLDKIKAQEDATNSAKVFPKKCEYGKTYHIDLDGDGKEEEFALRYRENESTGGYELSIVMDTDMVYDLETVGVTAFELNTEEFYITDISPFYSGVEIAILDYGPSNDLTTNFLCYDGEFYSIGSVGGFPFKEHMGIDGFAWEGCVKGILRTDLIHTCYSYGSWYYNFEERSLQLQDLGMYQMVPDTGHALLEDVKLYLRADTSSEQLTLAAQDMIFFLETDGKEWIKVKGKDGTIGYMHITDYKIDGVEKNPHDIISDIYYFD